MVEDSCQTKVTQLGVLISVEEDVAWFQISVQNALRSSLLISCRFLRLLVLSTVDRSCLSAAMTVIQA